jgi:hypothetical protein
VLVLIAVCRRSLEQTADYIRGLYPQIDDASPGLLLECMHKRNQPGVHRQDVRKCQVKCLKFGWLA